MIILLGGNGYVGTAFRRYFDENNIAYRSITRNDVDYFDKKKLQSILLSHKTQFLINAAGYTGKPNVDACEIFKTDCLLGNAVLPGIIKEVCRDINIPWGHVSSGCIYSGNTSDGKGFSELAPPNFSFRNNNCSFYSGCKALGEECLSNSDQIYVWRLRIPFNHIDSPRNYLSKLLRYDRLLEATNSISQIDEFARACFECFKNSLPFGIYNITNPGPITTREVVEIIKNVTGKKAFSFFLNEQDFMTNAAKTPRSNCVLNSEKILSYGINLTDTKEAIYEALRKWIPEGT
jgi:dTDP-4-dehydrorhamnose reductase